MSALVSAPRTCQAPQDKVCQNLSCFRPQLCYSTRAMPRLLCPGELYPGLPAPREPRRWQQHKGSARSVPRQGGMDVARSPLDSPFQQLSAWFGDSREELAWRRH